MSQTAALERAFKDAGRAGLTRQEIGEYVDPRFVSARIAALERKGWVFNKRPSKFNPRRTWRWVAVSWPVESEAEVEPETTVELPLFEAVERFDRPASALTGVDS